MSKNSFQFLVEPNRGWVARVTWVGDRVEEHPVIGWMGAQEGPDCNPILSMEPVCKVRGSYGHVFRSDRIEDLDVYWNQDRWFELAQLKVATFDKDDNPIPNYDV